VAALALRQGEVVLDVACGTGFCFAPILERIGPQGVLIAFDTSPALLDQARARIESAGWKNVMLMEATAEEARMYAARPAALLFSYAHDVLQSDDALNNLLGQAAQGARVAMCGSVLWPAWAVPFNLGVNAWLRHRHRHYIANPENFDRPWAKIACRLRDFRVARRGPGWRYLASGQLPG
jgi:SAM-dependent methyltransferase